MNSKNKYEAQIVSTYSRRMLVRTGRNELLTANIQGKLLKPVCGDIVEIEKRNNESDFIITKILPRKNSLIRKNKYENKEILASNLSEIVIVIGKPPSPDWFLVDRYIGSAEKIKIDASIICNKSDLNWIDDTIRSNLAVYSKIGYKIIECSAAQDKNLTEIKDYLSNKTTILVGQSGVGKSSIINSLSEYSNLKTQSISLAKKEGKHTTVNSNMIDLPNDGYVIDSPGVRDYLPDFNHENEASISFKEIHNVGLKCKYNDCMHIKEQECTVKSSVSEGKINERRYDSYKRLVNKIKSTKNKKNY